MIQLIMKKKISRRSIIKSLTGLTIGMGLTSNSFARSVMQKEFDSQPTGIDIKVLPPGPKSLALLERIKRIIGKTNYTGLYSISASAGKGVYMIDLDGNVYMDCLAAASTNILGYDNDEVAKEAIKSTQKFFTEMGMKTKISEIATDYDHAPQVVFDKFKERNWLKLGEKGLITPQVAKEIVPFSLKEKGVGG